MRKLLKWLLIALVLMIAAALVLSLIYRDRITRLLAVNSLFSEEKIVGNFSNMKGMFFNAPIPPEGPGDEVEEWPRWPAPLPSSFPHDGNDIATGTFLEETATTSLLVVRNGAITFEEYYLGTKPDDLRISWSVAKSFLSAVFGIAVENDQIESLDDPVTKYVPALTGTAYDGVTIRNTLNMATGVKFNEDYLDFWSDINKMGRTLALGTSMDDFAASLDERVREQGTVRQYTSIDTHVLAMVLRAATGRSLIELVGEQIVGAIGFEKAPYYLTDGEGVAFALAGLNLTTRDYARFGQMFLQHGKWYGKQIVPREWADQSVVATAPAQSVREDGFGYGYQWWIPPGAADGEFMARGIYDQYIYVNRNTNSVIVKTSANRKFREPGNAERTVAFFRAVAGAK